MIETIVWRDCTLCLVPIASPTCRHTEHIDGRVVMSEAEHERLVAELARLRNLEAEQD